MKNLSKIAGYLVATVLMFILTQSQVFAAASPAGNESSLSAIQVIGGFAVLFVGHPDTNHEIFQKANLNR